MKFGGTSANKSANHKAGMQTKFVCDVCKRQYKQDWSKNNHEKLCKEKYRK